MFHKQYPQGTAAFHSQAVSLARSHDTESAPNHECFFPISGRILILLPGRILYGGVVVSGAEGGTVSFDSEAGSVSGGLEVDASIVPIALKASVA